MKFVTLLIALLLFAPPARAEDLTLNDLPSVLYKLRGCTETHGVFGSTTTCTVGHDDLWVAIDGDGALTLFRKRRSGDTTYARGHSVSELFRDFARRINNDQAANKAMLEALAPYLPTQ